MRGYPSNHVGVVGYLLGKDSYLLPYKYKGVRSIENPQQSIKSSLFLVFTLRIRSSSSLALV
jgi:hypothetical protein